LQGRLLDHVVHVSVRRPDARERQAQPREVDKWRCPDAEPRAEASAWDTVQ
jgi:hypothetical protein